MGLNVLVRPTRKSVSKTEYIDTPWQGMLGGVARVLEEFACKDEPMSYTCPRCHRVSHNPEDERQRYCGACHRFELDHLPPRVLMEYDPVADEEISRCRVCLSRVRWRYRINDWSHDVEPGDGHKPQGPPFCQPAGMTVWRCKEIDLCDCFDHPEEGGQ